MAWGILFGDSGLKSVDRLTCYPGAVDCAAKTDLERSQPRFHVAECWIQQVLKTRLPGSLELSLHPDAPSAVHLASTFPKWVNACRAVYRGGSMQRAGDTGEKRTRVYSDQSPLSRGTAGPSR